MNSNKLLGQAVNAVAHTARMRTPVVYESSEVSMTIEAERSTRLNVRLTNKGTGESVRRSVFRNDFENCQYFYSGRSALAVLVVDTADAKYEDFPEDWS